MLWQAGPTGDWRNTNTSTFSRAVRGSSIAVIIDDAGTVRYRMFYQDPSLRLIERYLGFSGLLLFYHMGKQGSRAT